MGGRRSSFAMEAESSSSESYVTTCFRGLDLHAGGWLEMSTDYRAGGVYMRVTTRPTICHLTKEKPCLDCPRKIISLYT